MAQWKLVLNFTLLVWARWGFRKNITPDIERWVGIIFLVSQV